MIPIMDERLFETNEQPESTVVTGQSEMPCYATWFDVKDKLPEYDKKVLVIDNGDMFCGILASVTRSIATDSPMDDRWFASPK